MTTTLEIIDTAVKIGLGALISGLATYWVTREKHIHEIRKINTSDKRNVIQDVALKVEASSDLLAEFMHIAFLNNQEELEKNQKLLIQASNISGNARALASMIGFADLASAISDYHDSALEFHNHLTGELDKITSEETEKIIGEINDKLENIYPLLANAYENSNA